MDKKEGLKLALKEMWGLHDLMERALIKLERYFTDEELEELLELDLKEQTGYNPLPF